MNNQTVNIANATANTKGVNIFQAFFSYNIFGIVPLWLVVIAGVGLFLIWKFGRNRENIKVVPRIDINEIVRDEIRALFNSSKDAGTGGQILSRGTVRVGRILKIIYFNSSDIKTNATKNAVGKAKYFVGVAVCGTSTFRYILARFLGLGITYHLIDKEKIIANNFFEMIIDPYSQYQTFLGFTVYSSAGVEEIKELIVFKTALTQQLEEDLNFTPRVVFKDTQRATESSELKEIGDINKSNKNLMIEELKKGKA